MACIECGRRFHDECEIGDCEECHGEADRVVKNLVTIGGDGRGHPLKEPEDVTDLYSTGRKRAAKLYPLFKDKPCEWQGKKNCGGGLPIVGCIDGLQSNRHHGPVKQVLRNEPGNVHRICTNCHHRWHAVNDPTYDEDIWNTKPHAPEEATELELIVNDVEWKSKK